MKQKLLLLLFTALIGLSACNPDNPRGNDYTNDYNEYSDDYDGPSTTCANITMGTGEYAYNNDFIYFRAGSGIAEYDLLSKETVIIPSKYVPDPYSSLYVDDTYIYFAYSGNNGLMRMTKDGKTAETVYEGASGYQRLYLTETHAYYAKSLDSSLFRRNFATGIEEEICSIGNGYFIEDDTIYALMKQNDTLLLSKSKIDDISFERVELSFAPIAVLVVDDTLYLSKRGTFEIIMYKNGKETTLPICSFQYQVLGNHLFYLDIASDNLKSYNLETGEERVIYEDYSSSFCILAERYIAISGLNTDYLYDLKTQTLELMYPQGEE